MRTWVRALYPRRCGRCGEPVLRGAPLLVLRIGAIEKIRCDRCADEAVPADLQAAPPMPSATITPSRLTPRPFVRIRAAAPATLFDYKAAQCREPGEDG